MLSTLSQLWQISETHSSSPCSWPLCVSIHLDRIMLYKKYQRSGARKVGGEQRALALAHLLMWVIQIWHQRDVRGARVCV